MLRRFIKHRKKVLSQTKVPISSRPLTPLDVNMSPLLLKIPVKRLDSLFGNAFPSLAFTSSQKCHFLTKSFKHMFAASKTVDISIETTKVGGIIGSYSVYNISITSDRFGGSANQTDYTTALKIEEFCLSVKRVSILCWLRQWTFRPTDTFLIDKVSKGKVLEWLLENSRSNSYQMYNKFGSDYSLGFNDKEQATLFKLTFGDEEITT